MLGGSSRTDLRFTSDNIDFVADVAAVNDGGYEDENRLNEFRKEFARRIKEAGLSAAGFSWRVEGKDVDGKTRLLLPRDGNWERLFDENFRNLLAWVKFRPMESIGVHRKDDDFDVKFWYTPNQDSVGGSYPSYRSSNDLKKNPIYNTLKRKKDQLKKSGYQGYRGVILCDGDCEQLRRGAGRIIQQFLRQTSSIAFVVVFVVEGHRTERRYSIRVRGRCYVHPSIATTPFAEAVQALFERDVPSELPAANDDVVNALNHLRWKNRRVGLSHHGGWSWDGRTMHISSRALHELLAGKLVFDDFAKVHRFLPDGSRSMAFNPFAKALAEGRMFRSISVVPSDVEDDDWVVFEFTEPDPAVSRLRTDTGATR